MQIQITIDGDTQMSRRFESIAANMTNWEPALGKTVDQLKEVFSNEVFETSGGAIDESWAPLSKAYAYRKAKLYPDQGILQATGKMRNSFVDAIDATSAQIWNAMQYFKYHQSKLPRHKLPRRMMMKLTQGMKEMVVKNFQEQMRNLS